MATWIVLGVVGGVGLYVLTKDTSTQASRPPLITARSKVTKFHVSDGYGEEGFSPYGQGEQFVVDMATGVISHIRFASSWAKYTESEKRYHKELQAGKNSASTQTQRLQFQAQMDALYERVSSR